MTIANCARGFHHIRPAILVATTGLAALLVAACSSGGSGGASSGGVSSGGTTQAGPTASASGTMTVATRSISGTGDVLVDAQGRTLYTSDQEATGKVLCVTSDCTAIWVPLTVASGQTPTAPAPLAGKLSLVMRPDGTSQVALNRAPLYSFSFDHAPGDAGGNGQKDSFGGTNFSWHVATASGSAPAPTAMQTPSSGYNYGY